MSAPDTAPLEVSGYPNANPVLTPYESLQPALAGVSLNTTLQGIGTRIVTHINVFIDLLTLANPAFNGLPTVNIE